MTRPIRRMMPPARPLYDDSIPPPASPPQFGRRRGRVVSWDVHTGENVIETADGILYENVPCLNNLDYLLIGPGDRVEIITYSGLWYVLGRITKPGTDEAQRLLATIAGITDSVAASEGTSSSSYTDLSTVGPRVQVTVPPSGQLWVRIRARIDVTVNNGVASGSILGLMSFDAVGSNEFDADDESSVSVGGGYTGSPSTGVSFSSSASDEFLLTDLNPGVTTFTAKYRRSTGASATGASNFVYRAMTVRGF